MSAMLESLLDDERRLRCCANDAAMAAGRPILVSRPVLRAVQRANSHEYVEVPAQSDTSDTALAATVELEECGDHATHNDDQHRAFHILVVDDNEDAASTMSALLESEGHRTTTAHDGVEAVREATRARYDAVLLDLGMPVMDGFEAAARLRRLWPAPALIACSAWDDAETRRRTADLGFSMHLRKPVPFQVLKAALREVSPVTADKSSMAKTAARSHE